MAGSLAALGDTPAAQQLPTAVPLTLRVAAARLAMNEGDAASRRSVVDLLWELALFIEDGSLSMAERKLRDLQQELQQAMEQGAEDAELERLMEELQQAMDEFLQELTRQAMEQGQQMPPEAMQRPQNGQTVDRRDLQEMLDRARELMRSGARDAAREMLAQLQEMLENLRAGHAAGAALAGRADAQRPAEDDPAAAAAAGAQLPDGPGAAPGAGRAGQAGRSRASSSKGSRVSRASRVSRVSRGSRARWASRPPSRRRCGGRWAS